MNYDIDRYQVKAAEILNPVPEDLLSRYKRQLSDNKRRSEDLQKLIDLLEENPKTLEILQLMGRV